MPTYIYEADAQGKSVKGTLKAPSLQMANLKLRARNLDPIYVTEKSAVSVFAPGHSVKSKEILLFTRQLAFLLSSGVSLVRSLNLSHSMSESMTFKKHIGELVKSVEGGSSFSGALRKKPMIFKNFYVNMVICAEETGLLDKILLDLANYMEKAESIKSKVKSAMMYPAVVFTISLGIIIAIILFIVPKFEELYSSSKAGLPALTQAFVDLSNGMRDNWPVLLGALVLGIVGFVQYTKTQSGKETVTNVVSSLPLFGKLQFKAGLARFCRALFSLSKSGVNLLESLDIAGDISDHKDIKKGLEHVKASVSQGKGFAWGLAKSQIFPLMVVNMTKVGEESGQIEKTYEKLTTYYEEEVENMIASLIKMIEPILIVILGGAIGTILLALYLPVFNIGDII